VGLRREGDGWRVLAYRDAEGVRPVSRHGRDLRRRFPELAAAVGALEVPSLLLDGEIAVFDRQILSPFARLRGRPAEEAATPPTLIAFDRILQAVRLAARSCLARLANLGPSPRSVVRAPARHARHWLVLLDGADCPVA